MDISRAHALLSDAGDDVNVKGSYVNCWEHVPKPRELSERPNMPPLPRADERA